MGAEAINPKSMLRVISSGRNTPDRTPRPPRPPEPYKPLCRPDATITNEPTVNNEFSGVIKPEFTPGIPTSPSHIKPPAYLSAEAQAVWASLVPALEESGLFTILDYEALGMCLGAWSIARLALTDIFEDKRGISIQAATGNIMKNPAVSTFSTASMLFTNLAREFGMTPGARARLASIVGQKEKSEFEKMLD